MKAKTESPKPDFDVAIVGAGFAGVYALHRLRGLGYKCRVFEAGETAGGTWYWNRYPGAACDIESLEYSYSFSQDLEQEWSWSERFARQPEILAYINHVVDRFDLARDIQFSTRVESAYFDETSALWSLTTDRGELFTARYCIMATGCLSAPKPVEYPGLEAFTGDVYHTAYWPNEPVDFSGKRVGIIGTGSSAIQSIPIIAEQAASLHVFQRTPNFSVPAGNRPMDPEFEREIKSNYGALRRKERNSVLGIDMMLPQELRTAAEVSDEERHAEYERRWEAGGLYFYTSFTDLLSDPQSNATLAEFAREKIRAKVKDPAVADLLCPKDHPFGTKRICADTNYFETYNRPNVHLVDVKSQPIVEFTKAGLRTGAGEFELDTIVFATGFDAMTGALLRIDIRGRDGRELSDAWAAGPRTYLGLMVAGFPNLFITTGPGSPSVLYNMVLGNEFHVEWISDCIEHLRREVLDVVEAQPSAEEEWVQHVNDVGNQTLFPQANSWYLGANVPGKPRMIMPYLGGFPEYKRRCNEAASRGYEGFLLESVR